MLWLHKMIRNIAIALVFLSSAIVSHGEFHYQNGGGGFGLDSQLALPMQDNPQIFAGDGGGGHLAMQLSALDYYTYMKRKEALLMPLIADLIRFHNLNNEVTAYVLNVDDRHNVSDYTSGSQRNDTGGSSSSGNGGGVIIEAVTASHARFPATLTAASNHNSNNNNNNINHLHHSSSNNGHGDHLDGMDVLFRTTVDLLPAQGVDGGRDGADSSSVSLLEQTLADLNDYCDNSDNVSSGNDFLLNNNNFNNLSFNLIPKDLLEATDLFWSQTPSPNIQSLLNNVPGLASETTTANTTTNSPPTTTQITTGTAVAGGRNRTDNCEKTNNKSSSFSKFFVGENENQDCDDEEGEDDDDDQKPTAEVVANDPVTDEINKSDETPLLAFVNLEDEAVGESSSQQVEPKEDDYLASGAIAKDYWMMNGSLVIERKPIALKSEISVEETTAEDGELIDVLLKQDVDLGFSLISAASTTTATSRKGDAIDDSDDDIQKLKALLEIKSDETTTTSKDEGSRDDVDLWNDAIIDAETGEYIQHLPLQLDDTLITEARRHLAEISEKEKAEELDNEEIIKSLEKAFNCNGLLFPDSGDNTEINNCTPEISSILNGESASGIDSAAATEASILNRDETKSKTSGDFNSSSEQEDEYDSDVLEEFLRGMMIQTPFQHHTRTTMPPNYGSNNLFQSPYYHHHPHHSHYGPTASFSSAVSSSIHLTNTSSESENGTNASTTGNYKMDNQDMALYSNTSSELNITSDGFLNSILNDEDLHLMDIGHEGMYSMRMLDSNATNNSTVSMLSTGVPTVGPNSLNAMVPGANGLGVANGDLVTSNSHGDRLEASSDSAVSSMASEPMSSLSDGEWGDAGSDSAQEYHQKYQQQQQQHHPHHHGQHHHSHHQHNGYNGGSGGSGPGGNGVNDSAQRQTTSIAQKKHHMFGKRYFQEQSTGGKTGQLIVVPPSLSHGSLKYDYSAYDSLQQSHNLNAIHQNGGHQLAGSQLPPPPAPPHHHQLTVDNMKNYQSDLANGKGLQSHLLPDVKYSCSLDFAYQQQQQQHNHQPQQPQPHLMGQPQSHPPTPRMINEYAQHNHTYPLPPHNSGAVPKPQARDKRQPRNAQKSCGSEDSHAEHYTRDEKRAKALGIPMTVSDIINLPMDEFNERLSKYELSETQLSLIRDIRRRGKNKVAAQNCRKRKLDQIMSLADEVKEVKKQKDRLQADKDSELRKQKRIKEKFTALYRHVFQYLRDPDGNLYSASQYSLQQSADGSVYLLPRDRKSSANGGPGSMNPSDFGRNHTQDG